jgi:hypothetical protein
MWLLTEGEYDYEHPVAVFASVQQARAAVPHANWDAWNRSNKPNHETLSIYEIPFGALPEGWLAERDRQAESNRVLSQKIEAERVVREQRMKDDPEYAEYVRTHSITTSVAVSYEGPVLS